MTPTQIDIGFDPISQKREFIQYVPLFSTLEVILQHEDVLSVLYAETIVITLLLILTGKNLGHIEMVLPIGKTAFLVVIKMH